LYKTLQESTRIRDNNHSPCAAMPVHLNLCVAQFR